MTYTAHINLSKEKMKVRVCGTSCETVKYRESLLGEKQLSYFETEETYAALHCSLKISLQL